MLFAHIIYLPLLGALFAGFGGYLMGGIGSAVIATISMCICFLEAVIVFIEVVSQGKQGYLNIIPWVDSGLFYCNWGYLFDTLTVVMLLVVTSVSSFVHFYSISYMSEDPHLSRFMSYISLFTFFMLILITGDNFLQMFLGWEGVGLCSYLLINFWFTRLQANKAAIKAMLVNRISDLAMVLGLLTIFTAFKTIEYVSVFPSIPLVLNKFFTFFTFTVNIIDTACLLLFIGAMGKSAQLFLHTWLPDAMEGPTPVSALIHAATMVTAGVFLLSRCSPLFENAPKILTIVIVIGAMTAFFAGTVGLTQNDLKKVIAYSTCSQLGYMIVACGLSHYNVGIFHLYNHAFFKALLFLSAGSVIHALGDEQDMRKMGGLRRILPYTYIMFVIGSLSLMGFPFLTGFYSKDPILELCYANYTTVGHFAYWLGTGAAICTAFYSTRLIYLTFLTKTNSFKKSIIAAHDAPILMGFPLAFLALGSIFIGYFSKDMFIGLGSDFWVNSIYLLPSNVNLIDAEFLPISIKTAPVIFSICGLFFAIFLYHFNLKAFYSYKITTIGVILYNFLNRKWFFDKVYQENIGQYFLNISYFKSYKLLDRGIIEFLGPYGLSNIIKIISLTLSKLHTGYLYNSSLIMLLALILSIFYLYIQFFSIFN